MTPLPHDAHAERVVLSGLLREPSLNAAVFGVLAAGDFYLFAHALVFDAALSLWAAFEAGGPAGVYAELRARGQLAELGGRPGLWLAETYEVDPTGFDCRAAAERVRVLSLRRRLIRAARERLALLSAGGLSPDELAAMAG